MNRSYLWIWVFFFTCAICVSIPAMAGEPTEMIRKTTDKIIGIVIDPALKGPEKAAERKRLVREAVSEQFNREEMSRRTLAQHWSKRTGGEKKEFVDLYAKLLEGTYLDKVEGYSGEKVLYEDETVDGKYAVVKVKILSKQGTKISVEYRLKKGIDWLVYDVSIEGVSLVNNYRTQFNSIIVRSSYKELIKQLKAKVETE
ncbi:MAG: ABC transporter substrate-binding protein [Proteobacteria bacterium]|nr:ABC transporter substrate-binding protein [Pseudomonadota bacterium]